MINAITTHNKMRTTDDLPCVVLWNDGVFQYGFVFDRVFVLYVEWVNGRDVVGDHHLPSSFYAKPHWAKWAYIDRDGMIVMCENYPEIHPGRTIVKGMTAFFESRIPLQENIFPGDTLCRINDEHKPAIWKRYRCALEEGLVEASKREKAGHSQRDEGLA